MKKLLLTFALVLTALASWAQRWNAPSEYDYPTSSVFTFQLRVDDSLVGNATEAANYEVAAFINGECRGKATFVRTNTITKVKAHYSLRAWHTDAEVGSPVVIKVFCPDNVVYSYNSEITADVDAQSLGSLYLYTVNGIEGPNPIVIEEKNIEGATYDVLAETSLTFNGAEPGDFSIDEEESPVTYELLSYQSNNYYIGQQHEIVAMHETPENGDNLTIIASVPSQGKAVEIGRLDTKVIIRQAEVLVTSIATSKDYYEVYPGANVYDMVLSNVTVLPEDASNKSLNIVCTNVATHNPFPNGVADEPGTYNLQISAVAATDDCNTLDVTVKVLRPVKIELADNNYLYLSKYRDSIIVLNVTGDNFNPKLVSVEVGTDYEFPAATATLANDGKSITMRGLRAGDGFDLLVYYGKEEVAQIQTTFAVVEEVKMPNGWDWVALAAVPASTNSVVIQSKTGEFASWLNQDANNKIIEIRSQSALVYNDPEYGMFGDISELTYTDGMYKIKGQFNDESKALLNLGSYLDFASFNDTKPVQKGYNWIGYPFQDARTFNEVAFYLEWHAIEGDVIIGKTGFAEYTANGWNKTEGFSFEPNKGYIYYTETEEPYYPFFGYENPEVAAKPMRAESKKVYGDNFEYDATQFADNMAMVAQLDGLYNASECVIGAFVGDECRGRGVFVDDNKAYISVAGKAGEKVTFRLYDASTGNYYDLPETVNYSMRAGSYNAPVMLSSGVATGIGCISNTTANAANENVYDLAGRRVNNAAKGIFISNGKKIIK